MYFFMPFTPYLRTIGIYVLAAIVPAVFLMRYIYNRDTVEREPGYLLRSLALQGVFAALAAIVLEIIGETALDLAIPKDSPAYTVVLAFLVVACAEEGAKLFFLRKRTWNDPNFSHLFDGVVYSAFVSLGFAAFENVKYVFSYGLGVAVPRALLAIPGHLGFSVFMGVFYGRARLCANRGNLAGAKRNMIMGFLSAVFLHGFYDACAMIGTGIANVLFYLFVAVMYVAVYNLIRRESRGDRPVY